jgi:hypothetical protein
MNYLLNPPLSLRGYGGQELGDFGGGFFDLTVFKEGVKLVEQLWGGSIWG